MRGALLDRRLRDAELRSDAVKLDSIQEEQRALCLRFGVEFMPPIEQSIVGVSLSVRHGIVPLNGLRHPPSNDTNGWYIWAGEILEQREDFFVPLHLEHLGRWRRGILRFLALPPGWRFLVAGDCEDVWFDPALLQV
jgi:hypothetical protein